MTIKRKTLLVSVYYTGQDPITWYDDMDKPDWLFLNDAVENALKEHNVNTIIHDAAIEDARPWLFSMDRPRWFTSRLYRLLANRNY